jgi:hypothetical protein
MIVLSNQQPHCSHVLVDFLCLGDGTPDQMSEGNIPMKAGSLGRLEVWLSPIADKTLLLTETGRSLSR